MNVDVDRYIHGQRGVQILRSTSESDGTCIGLTNSPSNTSTPFSSLVGGGERIVVPALLVCPPWGFCGIPRWDDCNRLTSADWITGQLPPFQVQGRGKKEEEERTRRRRRGHTNLQAARPKYTYYPSLSSDYTEPSHNSIISGPTLIDLSMRKRMLDYAFLGDCNRLKEVGRGGSIIQQRKYKSLTSLVKVRSAKIDSLNILP